MPLQIFKSTDTNAPVLKGTAGALTDLLDACLINGYTTASVTGITRSSTTATATIAANTTLATGDWVTISGANETDYNVTAQITVLSSTQFTYAVSNSPATPATGTILYRKAPAGWATAYTGTNKRVYRSPNSASNRFYMRIDDNTTVGSVREAYVRGYETMSDVDTGTGPFPTVAQSTNGLLWHKSASSDTTARAWTLIADDKTFYFIPLPVVTGQNVYHAYGFGHFISYKASDGYNTFLSGSNGPSAYSTTVSNTAYAGLSYDHGMNATAVNANVMLYVPRAYAQTGGAVQIGATSMKSTANLTSLGMATSGIVYPNGPDSGLWLNPVSVVDFSGSAVNIRGRFPGMYTHAHSTIPQSNYDTLTGVTGLSGVTLIACSVSNNTTNNTTVQGMVYFDITGAW